VVATAIGELAVLLSDGRNAFLAEPGSVRSFADAVLTALRDPEQGGAVGRGGRAFAEQVLDYRRYSGPLREFFTAVCAKRTG
jgi:glycosyltransferase involved in cell wall biosynthesis